MKNADDSSNVEDKKTNTARELVKPLRDLSQPAGEIAKKLLGPAADGIISVSGDIFSGLIGRSIKEWRNRNFISVMEKTVKFAESKGIDIEALQALPDGTLYAVFDGATKADDSELQDLWAGLLISTASNNTDAVLAKMYASTLENLSAREAKVLGFIEEARNLDWGINKAISRKTRIQMLGDANNEISSWRLRNIDEKELSSRPKNQADLKLLLQKIDGEIQGLHEKINSVAKKWLLDDYNQYQERSKLIRIGLICELEVGVDVDGMTTDLTAIFQSFQEYPSAYGVEPQALHDAMNFIQKQLTILSGRRVEEELEHVFLPERKQNLLRYSLSEYGTEFLDACST